MKYPVLETSDARRYLTAMREAAGEMREPSVVWRGEGEEELETSFVELLRSQLRSLQTKYGASRSDKQNSDFESEAAVVVHKLVPNEPLVLADFGFWMWLAVIHLPDLIEWRYLLPNGRKGDLKNFGVGARSENFLYRLWVRAEISLDQEAQDPYHLTRRGQVDFWRSHLIRQGYASVPSMARALVRFQYPTELKGEPKLRIAEMRELAPRMKRLRANLMYEVLDDTACYHLLEQESLHIVDA